MAANFDINVYINKRMSYREALAWLNINDIQYEISEISVIDNWSYENQYTIQNDNIKLIDKLLLDKKIIITYGILMQKYSFGFMMSYQENICEVDFWISTKELMNLDYDYINEKNINIYNEIINRIINTLENIQLQMCVIGVETTMSDDSEVDMCIENSYNVSCWILPKEYKTNKLENYSNEKRGQYFVYSRVEI